MNKKFTKIVALILAILMAASVLTVGIVAMLH